ncbi:unnamed protein product [Medioppia subpectinata]|uniref:ATP-dependent DNA helicase n=1 Tax=Medioppia subpectinata TaxID=1979941 RepID=A0A7R9PWL2_9ACAR|nr:unnamed protein product [Medioppia subpectinata]CAG2103448.1 unnamed protein product [Medioppia subpectinata]
MNKMGKKRKTITDFFSTDLAKQKSMNANKRVAKRTQLDVNEVLFVKEVTKCVDKSYKEVISLSDSQESVDKSLPTDSPQNVVKTAEDQKPPETPEEALKRVFGFDSFRSSLQEYAIKCVITGRKDVFVSMPTGAGKSLCYQLPAICDVNKLTIVVSPLIALITNQISALKKLRINAETINSHLTANEQKRIRSDLMSQRVGIKLLYITPEMAATQGFAMIVEHLYKSDQLSRVAIDEAHCVSQWGHDFRPDYLKLCRLKERYPNVVWIALTATASEKVVADIIKLLKLREPVSKFISPNFRQNLFYDIVFKQMIKEPIVDLKQFVLDEIGPKDLPPPKTDMFCSAKTLVQKPIVNNSDVGIIYCRTRAACDEIADSLSRFGVRTMAYHAGLTAHQRRECQEKWMTGAVKCIAATVSFGMGVDKAEVRFVVHWNLPQSLTGYYQESGRAGRDGKDSKCRIYYSTEDRNTISFLIKQDSEKKLTQSCSTSRASNDETDETMKRFEKMIKYCESDSQCRHSLLLSEFVGDDSVVKTGCKTSCDVCTHPKRVKRSADEFRNFMLNKGLKTKIESKDTEPDFGLPKHDVPQHVGKDDKPDKEFSMTDLIRKEFKRRNKTTSSNSSQDSRYMGFRSATDVIEPTNDRIKDVDLKTRHDFVNHLKLDITGHYNRVGVLNGIQLNDSHITRIAAEFELNVYKTKTSKISYRSTVAQFIRELNKSSQQSQVHSYIQTFIDSQNNG